MSAAKNITKDSVPDDEHAGVVFVNAVGVAAVMNSVVAGGVEDVLQRAYLVDQLLQQIASSTSLITYYK